MNLLGQKGRESENRLNRMASLSTSESSLGFVIGWFVCVFGAIQKTSVCICGFPISMLIECAWINRNYYAEQALSFSTLLRFHTQEQKFTEYDAVVTLVDKFTHTKLNICE